MQSSFFDLENRHKKLDERDKLIWLNKVIDWEDFRETLNKSREKSRKSKAGRKPFDVVLRFKVLVLQHLYNIGDDELEFQIRDRYSFCRFLGLSPEARIPDAKTIWLFREQLTKKELTQALFYGFNFQLDEKGFKGQKGQIIDASFVEASVQRNTREENEQIKAGKIPERFKENPNVGRQKDCDTRWARKNNEKHYGYKDHIAIDTKHKLIREYEVSSAKVHDSQVFFELLSENSSKDVWADSAYRSEENERMLFASEYRSQVHKKGKRNRPLNERGKLANRKKSRVRARVEHTFGSMKNEQAGMFTRVIGLARTKTKIGLMNLVYNIRRCASLCRKAASTA